MSECSCRTCDTRRSGRTIQGKRLCRSNVVDLIDRLNTTLENGKPPTTLFVSGTKHLKPEHRANFPTYSAYRDAIGMVGSEAEHVGWDRLRATGSSVSKYAQSYWDALRKGTGGTFNNAVDETLAEVNRLKSYEGASVPDVWSKSHSGVTKIYDGSFK